MNISNIVKELRNCACGRSHEVNIKAVEIGRGRLAECANILKENSFPTDILVVADKNALNASGSILEILRTGGFDFELSLYDDLRVAEEDITQEVAAAAAGHKGILSVGSGSCNDICRRGALLSNKEFAIFATAPSMDGFASDTAPITDKNFKATLPARQPSIIIGDTSILAKAPIELKTAGFGDILAKYVALADWRVSNIVTGEYFCERIADMVREILQNLSSIANFINSHDEKSAGAIMEALVLLGLAMKMADSVRPASGTEHIISHFWEIKDMEIGLSSDFHGRKVGVATLYTSRIYHRIILQLTPHFSKDKTDWEKVYKVYGGSFRRDVEILNSPTVTDAVSPEELKKNWGRIQQAVMEELPTPKRILYLLQQAYAAKNLQDINVSYGLGILGLQYHPYMRHRMTLMRLIPMTDIELDYADILDDRKWE